MKKNTKQHDNTAYGPGEVGAPDATETYDETRFGQALPALQDIKLNEQERYEIRQNLLAHMHASRRTRVWSVWKHLKRNFNLRPFGMAALSLCLFVGTSGIAVFAAERSLPGDALYAVKTRMNEPIAGLFKVSGEKRVAFEWELLERRLTEAEALAEATLFAKKDAIRAMVTKQQNRAEDVSQKYLEAAPSATAAMSAPADKTSLQTIRGAPATAQETRDRTQGETRERDKVTEARAGVAGETEAPVFAVTMTAATSTHSVSEDFAIVQVLPPEDDERIRIGKKVFHQLDSIFARHRDIIQKLELPLPHAETSPSEIELTDAPLDAKVR